jgi:hypothetical protein
MRIAGDINPLTHLDPETESILLRRLHLRINNFNELLMFLLRCNMDIKYVGSGEDAKVLIYYVTDYITKSALVTHVGLSAVEYAIKRNNEKFAGTGDEINNLEKVNRSLFAETVMALMSKQEVSHQQVMSYLIISGFSRRDERVLKSWHSQIRWMLGSSFLKLPSHGSTDACSIAFSYRNADLYRSCVIKLGW